jgi:hypothetical protein
MAEPSRGTGFADLLLVIELSQLYHAPWIDDLRHTRVGAWSWVMDFFGATCCATIGVTAGLMVEIAIREDAGSQLQCRADSLR